MAFLTDMGSHEAPHGHVWNFTAVWFTSNAMISTPHILISYSHEIDYSKSFPLKMGDCGNKGNQSILK